MKAESKENEMLPCPFCGGEPEIKQTGINQMTVKCRGCLIGIEQGVLRFSFEWLREKLIEKWNKRVAQNENKGS